MIENKIMGKTIKYTYEQVVEILGNMGYMVLSKTYQNARTKISFKDSNDYCYAVTLSNLLSGKKPNMVSPTNPYTIQNIGQFILNNKSDTQLLSTTYTNSKDILVLRCECGNVYGCACHKFIHRKKFLCNKCGQIAKGIRSRNDIHIVKDEFTRRGFVPLFTIYVDCETPLLCRDDMGYLGFLSYNNLRHGHRFGTFKTQNPYILQNMRRYIELYCPDVELLSKEIVDFYERLTFKCSCGNTYETIWSSFVEQRIYRCPVCSRRKSRFEKMTEDYLHEHGYDFVEEYSFCDCKDKNILRFDYCVFIDAHFVLIEVDGQFHFKNHFDSESLKGQKRRDKIKNEYCKSKQIKLIRIPYWEFVNGNYINILDKEIRQYQSS